MRETAGKSRSRLQAANFGVTAAVYEFKKVQGRVEKPGSGSIPYRFRGLRPRHKPRSGLMTYPVRGRNIVIAAHGSNLTL